MDERSTLQALTTLCELVQKFCVVSSGLDEEFDQLLNSIKEDTRNIDDLVPEQLQQHNKLIAEALKTLPDHATAAQQLTVIYLSLTNFLRGVLGHLVYPEPLKPVSEALQEQLKENLTDTTAEDFLEQTYQILTKTFDDNQANFEQFLAQLHDNLHLLDSLITATGKNNQANLNNLSSMDRLIKSDVQEINDCLETDANIETLKATVQDKVKNLVVHLDEFKNQEQERIAAAEQHVQELSERLKKTEIETTILQEHLEKERVLARKDPLTSLPNRAAFQDKMAAELQLLQQEKGRLFLAVGDVDNFKKLNDTYGHLAGDKVLVQVANVLKKGLHLNDFVCRYGGEEFVVLIRDQKPKGAKQILDDMREQLAGLPFFFGNKDNQVQVTISFGAAELKKKETPDALFKRADEALYEAKKTKNVTVIV